MSRAQLEQIEQRIQENLTRLIALDTRLSAGEQSDVLRRRQEQITAEIGCLRSDLKAARLLGD